MRFGWTGLALVTTALVIAGGCSSRSTPEGERLGAARAAIQGGTTDTNDTYAVGVCGGGRANCGAVCSGALITPNLVVTARHCVDDSPKTIQCDLSPTFGGRMWSVGAAGSQLWITTNTTIGPAASGWHSVQQIVTPTDTHVCGNDIALLILNDLVSSSEATPIIPGVQYPMDDARYSNKFEAIGYGATSPANGGTGTRRIKERIPIYCVPNSGTEPCPATDAMGNPVNINPNEFIAGDGTCEGDSGSSSYDDLSYVNGAPVSHGVLSRGGVSPDGTTCQGSLYTRLDAWRDLVVTTATSASSNWTLYPKPSPDWTVFVPAPPKKDAGTDGSSTPQTTPSGKGLGETCAQDGDCLSKACRDQGDGTKVCTAACSDASACADGYECRSGFCFVANAPTQPNGATSTTTTGGCGVAREPQPVPWRGMAVVLAATGAALVRRRRRNFA
jgi:hypothetical protein